MIPEILLVDDNFLQATTRLKILERTGHCGVLAGNAVEALKKIEEPGLSEAISLVITDHLMPGMNGPEFITNLRKKLPEVTVLVISGLLEAEDEYKDLNVIFRAKPFAPESLISLVKSLLDEPIGRTA
ncbi:response regulator [Acidipila rosea]|uniref:Response regulator receiver domain-containing protein n=1 Tax=Acidipila rosea TaxID=768535 RepID=A0A4R1LFZ2_9BACT|nr:response regulator [Acidipila rosea]MBW4027318.1 response regulator [Acidobacteriota bacterium]TCK75609.1 response regulator receiver domain-containing protein [Acidipila rosea]